MSDFDDSKDKVRRNLVSFSAILILVKFIGLDITNVDIPIAGKVLSSAKYKEHIYPAIFIIWCYLAYRFSASVELFSKAYPEVNEKFRSNVHLEKKEIADKAAVRALKGKFAVLGTAIFKDAPDNKPPKILDRNILFTAVKKFSPKINVTGKDVDPLYQRSFNRIGIGLMFSAAVDSDYFNNTLDDFRNELKISTFPTLTNDGTMELTAFIFADVQLSIWAKIISKMNACINTVFSSEFSEIIIGSLIGLAGGFSALTLH